jgi:hypothetical protein
MGRPKKHKTPEILVMETCRFSASSVVVVETLQALDIYIYLVPNNGYLQAFDI